MKEDRGLELELELERWRRHEMEKKRRVEAAAAAVAEWRRLALRYVAEAGQLGRGPRFVSNAVGLGCTGVFADSLVRERERG